MNNRSIAVQGIGFSNLDVATQGFVNRDVQLIPILEFYENINIKIEFLDNDLKIKLLFLDNI